MVLVYVDDIIIIRINPLLVQSIINKLQATFSLKNLSNLHYFLDLEVSYTAEGTFMSQTRYIFYLHDTCDLLHAKSTNSPMASSHILSKNDGLPSQNLTHYRSVIGALQYSTLTN